MPRSAEDFASNFQGRSRKLVRSYGAFASGISSVPGLGSDEMQSNSIWPVLGSALSLAATDGNEEAVDWILTKLENFAQI